MATKRHVQALKARSGPALLGTPGVTGVGVGRGDADDDYVLVVYVEKGDAATRKTVKNIVGDDDAVRIERSGRFRPL